MHKFRKWILPLLIIAALALSACAAPAAPAAPATGPFDSPPGRTVSASLIRALTPASSVSLS